MSELEVDVEELFPPKPGGMVDSARRKNAEMAAKPESPASPSSPRTPRPVKTQPMSASVATAGTYVVPTAAYNAVRLLGYDPNRKRAVVMTLDEPVVIATSAQQAGDPRNAVNAAGLSAGGFVLPVNTPLVIDSASEVWAAATSSTGSRVSFWSETYS